MRAIFTTVAVLVLLNASALGQVGSLDNSFGVGGKVTTLVTYTSGARAAALQSDGKIVAAGYGSSGSTFVFALERYNTDGSVDTTFDLGLTDTTRVLGGNSFVNAVAIEPNGKIIVAGRASNAAGDSIKFALARYTSNGIIDSTFGANGIDVFYIGSWDDEGNGVAVQPNGKIVVSGFSNHAKSGNADIALIRVDTTGALDTTFGSNKTGKVLTAIGPNNDRGYAVALQPDGKILVSGGTNNGITRIFALVRYDSTGIVDSSFGKKGVATADFWSNSDFAYSMAFQPNGKIILGGITIGASTSFALVRIDTNGTLDNTFGPPGSNGLDTSIFYGSDDEIRSIIVDSIGRIIAAGFTLSPVSALDDFALARYDTSGIIDSTFGDDYGKIVTAFGTTYDTAGAVIIEQDNNILLAGCAHNAVKEQFALASYNVTDVTSGVMEVAADKTNSLFLYPNPVQDEVLLKYACTTNEILTINVYDVTGRLVEPVFTNENRIAGSYEETLNLGNLPAGFYILNLTSSNSQSLSIKLIKE